MVRVVKVSHIVYFEPDVRNKEHTFIQLTGVGNQFIAEETYQTILSLVNK